MVAELYGEVAPAPPEDREEGHVRSVRGSEPCGMDDLVVSRDK